jgi:uncharacterized protein YdaU (DUF1376 family)
VSDLPYLPLFTDALIADTDHLEHDEFGLYLRVLIVMWRSPQQRIPNDDQWLSRRFRVPAEPIRKLIAEFCQTDGNWITQKRLLREWSYVTTRSKKQSDRSKKRWEKEKSISRGNAAPHDSGNAPTPTPTPTFKKEEEKDFRSPKRPGGEDLPRTLEGIVSSTVRRRNAGVDWSDPAARKARWEQKVIDEINRRLPAANAAAIVGSYLQGEAGAKDFFEEISADMRRREARNGSSIRH